MDRLRVAIANAGLIAVVRWLGLLVLAVVCLFALDAARAPFRAAKGLEFLAGTVDRFQPWTGDAPDPRWDGCHLASLEATPLRITLHLACEDAPAITVTLTPRADDGAPVPADDCAASATAGKWLRCALEGAPTPERAATLRALVVRDLDAILPLVSARRPLVSDVHPDDDRLSLTRPLRWTREDASQSLTAFLLCGFLWLSVTGRFDPRGWRSGDAWVLAPLVASAVLRLWVCPRSLQEVEVLLYDDMLPTKHSYLAPLLGRVLRVLPGDAHEHEFLLGGLFGVLVTVPLFRFVESRTGSAKAAALVAMAVACHPIAARFAPTDAAYGLMMFTFFQAVYGLGVPTATSVVAGAVSLAIAVACRADGVLLIPVAALLVGPRAWRELLTTHRRALIGGLLLALPVLWLHVTTVLPSTSILWETTHDYTGALSVEPRALLQNAWWTGPSQGEPPGEGVARRVWEVLALLGGVAALARPALRWGLAALVGGPILAALYPDSWMWAVSMHRLAPSAHVLAVASGAALAAVVVDLDRVRPRLATAVTVLLLGVPVALASASSSLLTRLWSFNVEWEMARTALAPGGVERPECTVLVLGPPFGGDLDLHDFGQTLYATEVVDCRVTDCVALVQDGRCYRYVRALGAYEGTYPDEDPCRAPALTGAEAVARCRPPVCVQLEEALSITPIVERTIAPGDSYLSVPPNAPYPTTAVIGVYEVGATR